MDGWRVIKAGGVLTVVWALLLSLGCNDGGGGGQEIVVFAAASLSPALAAVTQPYESATGAIVLVSTGGSQSLARQIAAGAPADVFIPAGSGPVEFLEEDHVQFDRVVPLLGNRLVIVTRAGGPKPGSVADLAEGVFERVAMADPELAPAGAYARQALEAAGVWEAVRRKSVFGSDVRVTVAYVQTGNADAALVYATDARIAEDLVVSDVVAQDSYTVVEYPAVVLAGSQHTGLANQFVDYLRSPRASEVFARFGFLPLAP